MQAALRQEKPQLEVRRAELLRREEELKMSLHQLQENVLHELANAHGDILQNKVYSHFLMLLLEYSPIYFSS